MIYLCVATVTQQQSTKQTPAPLPPPSAVSGEAPNSNNLPDLLPSPPGGLPLPNSISEVEPPSAQTNSHSLISQPDGDSAEGNLAVATTNNNHAPSQLDEEDDLPPAPTDLPPAASDLQDLVTSVDVPEKIGPELLEEVRKSTGLSFEKSKIAVETVLGYVGFKVPALEGLMDRVLNSLHFGVGLSGLSFCWG